MDAEANLLCYALHIQVSEERHRIPVLLQHIKVLVGEINIVPISCGRNGDYSAVGGLVLSLSLRLLLCAFLCSIRGRDLALF